MESGKKNKEKDKKMFYLRDKKNKEKYRCKLNKIKNANSHLKLNMPKSIYFDLSI